jgi:hypothetical protein
MPIMEMPMMANAFVHKSQNSHGGIRIHLPSVEQLPSVLQSAKKHSKTQD